MLFRFALCLLTMAGISGPLMLGSFASAQTITIDQVVAIVDNEPIMMSEYESRHTQERLDGGKIAPFNGQLDRQVLENLIDEKKFRRRMRVRRGIQVAEEEVDSAGAVYRQSK